MFEIHITSFLNAERMMREGWPSHIITALGARDIIPSMGDHHLVLEFDDTEVSNDATWVPIAREQIEQALSFTKELEDYHRLLIHCRAGKSRSTAIALGVLMQHGMSAQEALDTVLTIRPVAIPNRLIVEYIDAILETEGALSEVVDAYYKRLTLPGVVLPDRGGWNH